MHPGGLLGPGPFVRRALISGCPAPIAALFDKRIKGITDAASRAERARDTAANWAVWCIYTVTRSYRALSPKLSPRVLTNRRKRIGALPGAARAIARRDGAGP